MLTVNTLETIVSDSDQDQHENQVLHCQSEAGLLIQGNQDMNPLMVFQVNKKKVKKMLKEQK